MKERNQSAKFKAKENMWVNFGFNLIFPVLILRKGDDWFGETIGNITKSAPDSTEVSSILLIMALFSRLRMVLMTFCGGGSGISSILGTVSALLTGGIGLMPGGSVNMFALKEATVPAILAVLVVVTLNTKKLY